MNKALLVLLLVISINAVELQHGVPTLLAQIKSLKADSNKGEEFKSLLDLELSQGSKVDEVVEMVGELLTQLKDDQQVEDLEHAREMTGFNLDIAELEINLESLGKERQITNQFVADATAELTALGQTIENLTAQLNLLNGREEDIREVRGDEIVAYQHRTQNNNKVLNALNEILPKLGDAVFSEQDKQKVVLIQEQRDAMVDKIKRELGHNNPIALMVEMTAQFDIGTVTRIIEKLETIRDAVAASQVDEDNREVVAQQNFQSIIQEISEVRTKLANDFNQSTQLFKRRTNEKVNAERRLGLLNDDITTTQSLLVNTRNQRESYDANYQDRKGKRGGEIKLVQSAYDLVSQQAAKIKAQGGF